MRKLLLVLFLHVGVVCTEPALGVSLTFDDGPDARYTPKILEVLEKHQISATFFVVGKNVRFNTGLAKEILARGHSLGNHSYSHAYLTRLSSQALGSELQRTNEAIISVTGKAPSCFRPPYGAINAVVRTRANEMGMKVTMWDVDSKDFTGIDPDKMARTVVASAKANDVILFHDLGRGGNRTAAALEAIIVGLKAKGFEFENICP